MWNLIASAQACSPDVRVMEASLYSLGHSLAPTLGVPDIRHGKRGLTYTRSFPKTGRYRSEPKESSVPFSQPSPALRQELLSSISCRPRILPCRRHYSFT
jgi:hypothetical protein